MRPSGRIRVAALAAIVFCGAGRSGGAAARPATVHAFALVEGRIAAAGVRFDTEGALYGAAQQGGVGSGTVFRLTPRAQPDGAWSLLRLHPFRGGRDGAVPVSAPIFGGFGALYGTTNRGGSGDCRLTHCGTVFELIPPQGARGAWRHRVLANFDGRNGGDPEVAPTFLLGSLYGTADYGGSADLGTVFRLTPASR